MFKKAGRSIVLMVGKTEFARIQNVRKHDYQDENWVYSDNLTPGVKSVFAKKHCTLRDVKCFALDRLADFTYKADESIFC